MADRKYLLKRGGVWSVRFRLPARLGGGIFLRSLGTGDITAARKYRDLHIMPFLAGEDQFAATEALIEKAAQLGAAQDQRFKNLQAGRLSDDRGETDTLTLRTLAVCRTWVDNFRFVSASGAKFWRIIFEPEST